MHNTHIRIMNWLAYISYSYSYTFILCVATAVTTVQGVGVQQADVRSDESLSSKYSCANPVMEIVERFARILFIVSS